MTATNKTTTLLATLTTRAAGCATARASGDGAPALGSKVSR